MNVLPITGKLRRKKLNCCSWMIFETINLWFSLTLFLFLSSFNIFEDIKKFTIILGDIHLQFSPLYFLPPSSLSSIPRVRWRRRKASQRACHQIDELQPTGDLVRYSIEVLLTVLQKREEGIIYPPASLALWVVCVRGCCLRLPLCRSCLEGILAFVSKDLNPMRETWLEEINRVIWRSRKPSFQNELNKKFSLSFGGW